MSPRKRFDRFMVDNEHGRNLKIMRLTDAEYRAWMSGVLPIASKADVRGAFMVGRTPATAQDVVHQSPKTSRKTAESLLSKLRDWGMLERDDELGGEWVHDWDELNPAPRADPTNAKRQADFRARNAARNATSNGARNAPRNERVTPPEVEGEVEDPPNPPDGGSGGVVDDTPPRPVKFNGRPVPQPTLLVAQHVLANFNRRASTSYEPFAGDGSPSENLKRVLGALRKWPQINAEVADRMIRHALERPFWGDARPHLGHVFGPGVVEQNLAAVTDGGNGSTPPDELRRKLLGPNA